ncbi:hypothetical protein ACHAWF_006638 [Thalassiosira exigua]
MGNSQSTDSSCPQSSPLCRALCLRSGQPAVDDGEWYEDLRGNKKKSRRKSSRSQRNLTVMPVVPEESDPSEVNEENDPPLGTPGSGAVDTRSDSNSTSATSLDSSPSEPASEPVQRRASDPHSPKKGKSKKKRKPKTKLTFVNGQFVDISTEEGQEMVKAASSGDESWVTGGILVTVKSGHCGILGPQVSSEDDKSSNQNASSENELKVSGKSMNPYTVKTVGKKKSKLSVSGSVTGSVNSSMAGSRSGSLSSFMSTCSASTQGSLESLLENKDAVTSIVVLGEGGYLLTASKRDRFVKMWKVDNSSGKVNVEFVRDFTGHATGVTCLAKVDDKGRFLSASKDRQARLWDSRFNCNDTEEDAHANRISLASFDDMDRRSIQEIAITDDAHRRHTTVLSSTDKLDAAMAAAMTKKAMKEGSAAVQQAAQERQIIACSCEFATISGRHKVVKMWSVKHVDQSGDFPPDANVAQVKLDQELKHEAVVESIASMRGKGMLLTGDRMGNIILWRSSTNVFLPGSTRAWSNVRTFAWRRKSVSTVDETMQFAITSLTFLQEDKFFASGSRGGNLRVWDTDGTKTSGETVKKELICITGAHSEEVTALCQGPQVKGGLSFSSSSNDGKILSFAIPASKIGSCQPCCFNATNHGIANRYVVDAEPIAVTALACLDMPGDDIDMIITGSSEGDINVMKTRTPKQGPENDALLRYRESMEEESLTLHSIADKLCDGAVEVRNRKQMMKTYKNCFLGSDVVSFLVDNGYAASREDAVRLGSVLETHLSLFDAVSKKGKAFEDSSKSYYRLKSDASDGGSGSKMKKWKTSPDVAGLE